MLVHLINLDTQEDNPIKQHFLSIANFSFPSRLSIIKYHLNLAFSRRYSERCKYPLPLKKSAFTTHIRSNQFFVVQKCYLGYIISFHLLFGIQKNFLGLFKSSLFYCYKAKYHHRSIQNSVGRIISSLHVIILHIFFNSSSSSSSSLSSSWAY
jgi:hypothetical protein